MIIIEKEFKSISDALNQINASSTNKITLYENIRGAAVDEIVKLIRQKGRPCDLIILHR